MWARLIIKKARTSGYYYSKIKNPSAQVSENGKRDWCKPRPVQSTMIPSPVVSPVNLCASSGRQVRPKRTHHEHRTTNQPSNQSTNHPTNPGPDLSPDSSPDLAKSIIAPSSSSLLCLARTLAALWKNPPSHSPPSPSGLATAPKTALSGLMIVRHVKNDAYRKR